MQGFASVLASASGSLAQGLAQVVPGAAPQLYQAHNSFLHTVHGVAGQPQYPGTAAGAPTNGWFQPGGKLPANYPTLAKLGGQVAWGPFLKYVRYDPASQRYDLSVLVVCTPEGLPPAPPTMTVTDGPHPPASYGGEMLAQWDRYSFFRFKFTVTLGPAQRPVQYQVVLGPHAHPHTCTATRPYVFSVPAAGTEWHWGFYSCNGFHEHAKEVEYGGIGALWRHVMATHAQRPLHVMVGGGDQLYNDDVWAGPVLSQWMVKDDQQAYMDPAVSSPFLPHMRREAEEYFFSHYVQHFSLDPFQQALASIPSIMSWDDHDIFDGWGSYLAPVQNAPVMQGVYHCARFFYLLFQLHTTEQQLYADGYWGSQGCGHQLCAIGPGVALLALDTRSARTQQQIVPPADLQAARTALLALPPHVMHVVVVAPVPMLYPDLPVQKTLQDLNEGKAHFSLQMLANIMQKTGLGSTITNSRFGMVDLLDDLIDHWSSPQHHAEREAILRVLLEVAAARCLRVSLVSGDVHVAGYGMFHSAQPTQPERDPRFIPQIISSAIGNEPPPEPVVKALQMAAQKDGAKAVMQDVVERMVPYFADASGAMQCIRGCRNWCEVILDPHSLPPGGYAPDAALQYVLHMERTKGSGAFAVDSLTIRVPRLLPPGH